MTISMGIAHRRNAHKFDNFTLEEPTGHGVTDRLSSE